VNAWKRFDFLVHRWIGMILGVLVLVWFASGVVMMYYRWPALTESQQEGMLQGFGVDTSLIGFSRAALQAVGAAPEAERFRGQAVHPGRRAHRRPATGDAPVEAHRVRPTFITG
jgi:hypothetical protein